MITYYETIVKSMGSEYYDYAKKFLLDGEKQN